MEEFVDSDFVLGADYESDMITVVGSAFHQPIADLIGKLALRKSNSQGGVRVGHFENGYSVSIITLMILAFESYVTRVHFLRSKSNGNAPEKGLSTYKYLHALDSSFPYADELAEIYIVRDAVAHAHLWQVNYRIQQGRTDVTKLDLFRGYGDRKMRALVDQSSGITKNLGLHVLPTSIGVKEVTAVFKVIAETMEYLVKSNFIERAAVRGQVRYGGKNQQFWSLYADLVEISA